MKKKPVILSPTPKKLVVLDVHTASSSRTSSDSEQSQGSGSQAAPPKKIWISKFRGKESSKIFHRKRTHAKYYRMQKHKNADGSYKTKQKPRPKGKCFKCGKRGHLRTKCESKNGTLTNVDNEPVSTFEPRIQAPQEDVPKAKSTKPKKDITVNDLQKEIKETYSEVQTLKENLTTLRIDHNQRLKHLENTLHQGNEKRTSSQNPSDEEVDEKGNPIEDMVQEKFLETKD